MKKQVMFLAVSFMAMWFAAYASAAEVTLTWDPVNFEICGSNPALSGYRLYRSFDKGDTKTLIPAILGVTATTYTYEEAANSEICYYATAYNQVGESAYSDPACTFIANGPPEPPTGLRIMLEKIVSAIQEYLGG